MHSGLFLFSKFTLFLLGADQICCCVHSIIGNSVHDLDPILVRANCPNQVKVGSYATHLATAVFTWCGLVTFVLASQQMQQQQHLQPIQCKAFPRREPVPSSHS